MVDRKKKAVGYIVSFGAGILILIWLLSRVGITELANACKGLDAFFVFVAISMVVANVFYKSKRWQILVNLASTDKISMKLAMLSTLSGIFGGNTTPIRGGVFLKSVILKRYGIPYTRSIALIMVEYGLDFMILMMCAALGLALIRFRTYTPFVALFCLLCFSLLFLFFPLNPLKRVVQRFHKVKKIHDVVMESIRGMEIVRESRRYSVYVLTLSFLTFFFEFLILCLVLRSFGLPIPILMLAAVYFISVSAGVLSMIPAGMGVTELSMVMLLTTIIGIPSNIGYAVTLIYRLISSYLIILIGGMISTFWITTTPIKKD
ncbi:MAG: lysylphosphatidylglycerol synthase transmembrane domain-containing protein [Methanocellales archaeon]|nr:lysylphosphatidylglycerol synthase transmembrane domain-containing protein [Methanocellales archaeon]